MEDHIMNGTYKSNDSTNRPGADGLASEAMPNDAVARIVSELEKVVTLMRQSSMQRGLRPSHYLRFCLPASRMEMAILITLAETYGQAIVDNPRFYPVLSFVAERGAVALVQEVLFGDPISRPKRHGESDSALLSLLAEVRPAFEFLCGTWPEIFMPQANTVFRRLGAPALTRLMTKQTKRQPRCIGPSDGQASAA
ncbi:hypothetical protein A9R05_38970 (plasmid) [Burkholderia sp. KK1]|nr:hypothetical protein A9R05_38970 [Burkholderia sp. KK1]